MSPGVKGRQIPLWIRRTRARDRRVKILLTLLGLLFLLSLAYVVDFFLEPLQQYLPTYYEPKDVERQIQQETAPRAPDSPSR